LCLGARVRFLDPVPKSAIPDLLTAADIGVHSLADVPLFRYGVSPNKIYDYMGAALPIVTNTPGEVAGLVVEAGAGIAVGPTGLAQGIRDLAKLSPEQRVVIGESGRTWLDAGNSRSSAVEKLRSLLEQMRPSDDKAEHRVDDVQRYSGVPEEGRS
jgi:glycosyltransferase involved in cell wall biosynthesis